MLEIIQNPAEGFYVIKPKVFADSRGYFTETYNEQEFKQLGLSHVFVQDNQSYSDRGVLRGLHLQAPPFAQTKLVRVVSGKILDAAVDLRRDSKTFKRVFLIEVSAESGLQILIPKGFAHGFLALEKSIVAYKCDELYSPKYDGGIAYNDPDLNIKWPVSESELIISEKDRKWPKLKEFINHE